MKRVVSIRDIIRLYHTEPIPERMIERPKRWKDKIRKLKEMKDGHKVCKCLISMYKANIWSKMHVLPDWFVQKYNLSERELTYEEMIREELAFSLCCFSDNVAKFFTNGGIYKEDNIMIHTREDVVTVKEIGEL